MDIIDLNDWIYENHREVWEATRYLHPTVQYACWFKVWTSRQVAALEN